jgi:hypothetical protein
MTLRRREDTGRKNMTRCMDNSIWKAVGLSEGAHLIYFMYQTKKVNHSPYRPGVAQKGFQEVKVPRFHDNDTGRW